MRLSTGYCGTLTCEALTAECNEEWGLTVWLKVLAGVTLVSAGVLWAVWWCFEDEPDTYKND